MTGGHWPCASRGGASRVAPPAPEEGRDGEVNGKGRDKDVRLVREEAQFSRCD